MKKFLILIFAVLISVLTACSGNGGKPADTASDSAAETGTAATETSETDAETAPGKPEGTPVKVIMIAGQSNAVGYAYDNFNARSQEYDAERIDRIRAGFDSVKIRFSNNALEDASSGVQFGPYANTEFEPVTFNQGCRSPFDGFQSIGPEVGLAEYLAGQYPDETFYIVKCATSGSNLSDRWNPDNIFSKNNLYRQMVEFTTEALGKLEEQGLAPEIIAFCWMQGESDAQENYADRYADTFENMINTFKKDLSRYIPENGMAVVDAGITDKWPNYNDLNAAKQGFADLSNKRFFFGTNDLTLGNDNMHYSNYAQLTLGNRFGEGVAQAIALLDQPEVID